MCGADMVRPPPEPDAVLAGAVVTGGVPVVAWLVAELVALALERVVLDAHPASTAVAIAAPGSTAPRARREFIRLTVDRQIAEAG
jgi:hypothetical protein